MRCGADWHVADKSCFPIQTRSETQFTYSTTRPNSHHQYTPSDATSTPQLSATSTDPWIVRDGGALGEGHLDLGQKSSSSGPRVKADQGPTKNLEGPDELDFRPRPKWPVSQTTWSEGTYPVHTPDPPQNLYGQRKHYARHACAVRGRAGPLDREIALPALFSLPDQPCDAPPRPKTLWGPSYSLHRRGSGVLDALGLWIVRWPAPSTPPRSPRSTVVQSAPIAELAPQQPRTWCPVHTDKFSGPKSLWIMS
jgi:hypothetical protein